MRPHTSVRGHRAEALFVGGVALWDALPALVFFLPSGFTQSPAAGVLVQPPRADDILEKDS